jgi:hypothetical protein
MFQLVALLSCSLPLVACDVVHSCIEFSGAAALFRIQHPRPPSRFDPKTTFLLVDVLDPVASMSAYTQQVSSQLLFDAKAAADATPMAPQPTTICGYERHWSFETIAATDNASTQAFIYLRRLVATSDTVVLRIQLVTWPSAVKQVVRGAIPVPTGTRFDVLFAPPSFVVSPSRSLVIAFDWTSNSDNFGSDDCAGVTLLSNGTGIHWGKQIIQSYQYGGGAFQVVELQPVFVVQRAAWDVTASDSRRTLKDLMGTNDGDRFMRFSSYCTVAASVVGCGEFWTIPTAAGETVGYAVDAMNSGRAFVEVAAAVGAKFVAIRNFSISANELSKMLCFAHPIELGQPPLTSSELFFLKLPTFLQSLNGQHFPPARVQFAVAFESSNDSMLCVLVARPDSSLALASAFQIIRTVVFTSQETIGTSAASVGEATPTSTTIATSATPVASRLDEAISFATSANATSSRFDAATSVIVVGSQTSSPSSITTSPVAEGNTELIGGIVGGVAALLMAICVLVVTLVIRRRRSLSPTLSARSVYGVIPANTGNAYSDVSSVRRQLNDYDAPHSPLHT